MEPLSARVCALLQLTRLDALPRTGWLQRGVPRPESIAGHVLGAAHIALALAARLGPGLDLARLLALILLHDAPEALTGDLPRSAARHLPSAAKRAMESGAARELLLPLGEDLLELWQEYAAGTSREARLARLCDRLQLGVQLLAYRQAGIRGLEEFEQGLATLDCQEFSPAESLRQELLAGLADLGS